jgi:tetratricopeptide (TPR) repeat protein
MNQNMGKALSVPAPKNFWIMGPKRDLIFFILTPLLIVPLVLAIKDRIPLEMLGVYVLGLGGFGHHLPGFIRAYSDPDLFKRFRLRFTVIPILLVATCGAFSLLNLNAFACATVAWGTWHGAMQINGFARIYDSKAGSFRPWTAKLDWLMCIAWFGLAILHSPSKLFSLITQFYVSGGFLIPPGAFSAFRWFWDASAIAITTLFIINAWRRRKAGENTSLLKLLTMASSFGFWWYCIVTINNLILGLVMWEIFHDIQYNVLVWLFQRKRVDGDLHAGRAEKFLFKPGWARLALYALLVLAYGSIGVATSFADVNLPEKVMLAGGASQWLLRITLASAILHFYYDGFIWKIREQGIRQGLGMQEGKAAAAAAKSPAPAPAPSKSMHGWLWALFAVPVAAMGIHQYLGWSADFKSQVLNLSEAIPGSWLANFLAGTYYKGEGNLDEAERNYRKAAEANPDFSGAHLFLADILYRKGNFSEAAEHFRRAVELEPDNLGARSNLAHLYLKMGQPMPAMEQFEAALSLSPDEADLNFGLASALVLMSRAGEAEGYLEKTLRLSPGHSGALNYLGMIKDLQGDVPQAIEYYRKALASDSGNASAQENLRAALAKSGPSPAASRR